jgi:hypothetical protein
MKDNLHEGDLCIVIRSGTFTLCRTFGVHPPAVRECPVKEFEVHTHPPNYYENTFENLEGKVGLIVYVVRNRLDQPMGYRVLIEGKEMFCKSKVAEKYIKLVGTQGNESR